MSTTESNEKLDSDTYAAIDAAWSSWGRKDSDVIAHLINPAFLGGPAWPALRQAHAITRRDDAILVASSGLADPTEWDDAQPTNGFGLEVYGIGEGLPADSDTMAVAGSWLGRLVMDVSNQVANLGFRFGDVLARYGLLTMALPGVELPGAPAAYYQDGQDPVVMFGLTDAEVLDAVAGPLSTIRLVNVKLLTLAEGRFCVENAQGSASARDELARRFAEQGRPLRSSLDRPSVV